jgi:imidazolonepropionase
LTLRSPDIHRRGAPRRGTELNELGIIQDGALLIRDGILIEVGPTRRVENLAAARNAVEINAAGRIVLPGFVDSHTHLAFPPPGAEMDLAAAAKAICAGTGKRLAVRSLAYIEAMARHGATTVEVKTGCGPDESAEMKILRVLGALKNDPLDVAATFLFRLPSPNLFGDAAIEEAANWMISELLPKIHRRRLAKFVDVAWNPDCARHACFSRFLEAARGLGFSCKIHADKANAGAAIAMAIEYSALSIDHLEYASASEAAILGRSEVMATLLPCASFHTGRGNAPARALIDAGVPIVLASDFNASQTPTLNMQTVVALACLQMGLTPAEAISAATINGAHALGCAAMAGSLEPDKAADVVILNLADYRDISRHFGANLVHLTMKRGAVIYKEGQVTPPHPRDGLRNSQPVLN